jgi:3-methyladenine DNA glycosylase AlkD
MEVERVARAIDRELRGLGTADRARRERAYLKSELNHYGVTVPAIRAVAKRFVSQHPSLTRDELVALVDLLWMRRVHEQRMICVELLELYRHRLTRADMALLECLVRDARTWALVDGLAASVIGYLVDNHPELGRTLDRWVDDDDLWIRRSALLALLVPLRRGDGDFDRFSRYADAMLDDEEFLRPQGDRLGAARHRQEPSRAGLPLAPAQSRKRLRCDNPRSGKASVHTATSRRARVPLTYAGGPGSVAGREHRRPRKSPRMARFMAMARRLSGSTCPGVGNLARRSDCQHFANVRAVRASG